MFCPNCGKKIQSSKKSSMGILFLAIFLLINIAFLIFFWASKDRPKKLPSKLVSQQTLGENLTLTKTLSVEKISENKYQPILELKLKKPTGQVLSRGIALEEKIPKEFAQNTDQLSFSLPPTKILEKDPIIVWDFEEINPDDYQPETIEAEIDQYLKGIKEENKRLLLKETMWQCWQGQAKSILKESGQNLQDWLSGKIEELAIVISREAMGQKEALKIFNDASSQLAKPLSSLATILPLSSPVPTFIVSPTPTPTLILSPTSTPTPVLSPIPTLVLTTVAEYQNLPADCSSKIFMKLKIKQELWRSPENYEAWEYEAEDETGSLVLIREGRLLIGNTYTFRGCKTKSRGMVRFMVYLQWRGGEK